MSVGAQSREAGSRTQCDWQFSFLGVCSDAFETQVIFFCIITHNSLCMGLICTAYKWLSSSDPLMQELCVEGCMAHLILSSLLVIRAIRGAFNLPVHSFLNKVAEGVSEQFLSFSQTGLIFSASVNLS